MGQVGPSLPVDDCAAVCRGVSMSSGRWQRGAWRWSFYCALGWWVISGALAAETVRVAVAANFLATLQRLEAPFFEATGYGLRISSASSGQLYAQIRHGAPFELFLSADRLRPQRLEEEGLAVAGSRYTYAVGRLVLWSKDPQQAVSPEALAAGRFRHLALANPRTAPYGAAAREVLQRLGLWGRLRPRVARAQSVAQAFQFVAGGQAELGFVAMSQVVGRGGARWEVPSQWHAPLSQDLVLLPRGAERDAAWALHAFLRSSRAREVISRAGYALPPTGGEVFSSLVD